MAIRFRTSAIFPVRRHARSAAALALLLSLADLAGAAPPQETVAFNTSSHAAQWLITGFGLTDAPALNYAGTGAISFSDNAHASGNLIPGTNLNQFDGLWWANFRFDLPRTADNFKLSFAGLGADDKVLFARNGHTEANLGETGGGTMALGSGVESAAVNRVLIDIAGAGSGYQLSIEEAAWCADELAG